MKAALIALVVAGTPANDALFTLYAEGHYQDAMHRGEESNTAQSLAIAARAALADAMMRPEPCLTCLKRGEEDARRAIALDTRLSDAHVWLAASLGYQARILGVVRTGLTDNPAKAKAELDQAVALDPSNPYALAALGGWHAEVVRVGGEFLAGKIYDASMEKSLALFDRAEHAAPRNVAVHYQIALALAGLDMVRYRVRIESELQAAGDDPPQTAYEVFVAGRARELSTLIKRGDTDSFDAKLRTFQGYP